MNWTQKSTRRNCFVRGCLHMLNLGLLSTQKNIYFCIFVHRYLAARGYRGIIVSIDGWGQNSYCFCFLPFATLFRLLSIDLIYWPGLTRHQSLRCYQKTIFLVDVLKVTRYDWQKSHFSPVVCSQWGRNTEGGGQKFVPAVKKLYELQIFNFLRRWKVSGLTSCLNDLDSQDYRNLFLFPGQVSDYPLMIIGNWSQIWCRQWIIILLHLRGSPPVRDH